jgi:hypothetical protein
MAESAVGQLKDVPGTVTGTLRSKPLLALGVAVSVLAIVVLIEILYPGAITGKIRKAFNMVGIKGAA